MLKHLNIKKEYYLLIGTLLLLIISYQLAFKKTIEAFGIHQQLTNRLAETRDLTYQPSYLERKAKNLDQILEQYHSDSLALRGNTLSMISAIAEKQGVKLSEVPVQDPAYNTPDFMVERLDFEGNYFALLKTIEQLQQTKDIGIMRSFLWMAKSKNEISAKDNKIRIQVYFEVKK